MDGLGQLENRSHNTSPYGEALHSWSHPRSALALEPNDRAADVLTGSMCERICEGRLRVRVGAEAHTHSAAQAHITEGRPPCQMRVRAHTAPSHACPHTCVPAHARLLAHCVHGSLRAWLTACMAARLCGRGLGGACMCRRLCKPLPGTGEGRPCPCSSAPAHQTCALQLSSGQVENMRCPDPACRVPVAPYILRALFS